MTDEELKKYKEFMYDESNSHNCCECPENNGFRGKLPCGQQNCWVDAHNRRCDEES